MVFKIGKKILKLKSNLFYQYQSDTGFFYYCHILITIKKEMVNEPSLSLKTYSINPFSLLSLDGCFSFLIAFASI